jgi:outer membrane immunogenic protein
MAKMKKSLLTGIALTALIAVPAGAADLRVKAAPVYKAPPPVIVAYNWTGCYVGGHFGGIWATKDWSIRNPFAPFGGNVVDLGSHDVDSWLGGVQAGCDYQFAGGFVIGIQGDYAWTDADGSNDIAFAPGFTNHSKIKSLATVTGRIGYAWDRFLGYVKGGGAWEKDDYDVSFGGVTFATASETRSGWTIGVGGEYAFTNYFSGFVEYNYYDFGNRDNTFSSALGSFIVDINETKSVVRAGLNLRFGGWTAPVAAKY